MKQLIIQVFGLVQDVSFRAETKRRGRRLKLTGIVVNNPDGSVTIVAEGEEPALQQLFDWAKRGPEDAKVTRSLSQWRKAQGKFETFEIVR
jgi:acylphosphatase